MEALSEMTTIYPSVKVLHFEVDLRNNHLDFKFRLKDGLTHVPHYGLLLAGVAGLPNSVVETARDITARITEKDSKRMTNNCEQHHSLQMAYRVAQRLICLKYSNQGEDDVRRALENLKESYMEGRLTF
ncbi:DNA mismatch repair protein MSH4-like [Dendrobium catenatum]|uniref:DNA mismatch repair protein MSH4 n=2 Tax=Dendrobium catenatum TaxID=906689 RepID=A0A2I0XDA3_9ASPA|nr:DNA mismatch repair protein MSH4-like [Dendrobium catenatum]PKU85885.1 DNA mismatch repair protein MSH4 [Dendrobium catenatum]